MRGGPPTGNGGPRATIDDVARRARVSIKTVSRVANREPNVRAETRARVQAAIDALGYRPNAYARELASMRRREPSPPRSAATSRDS